MYNYRNGLLMIMYYYDHKLIIACVEGESFFFQNMFLYVTSCG